MIRGVIFDLDGVLVRTDELHYRSWRELTAAEGIPFDRVVNERLKGMARADCIEVLLENAPRRYDSAGKADLARRKNNRFRQMLATLEPSDASPGAAELLAELRRRGLRLALASSSCNAALIVKRIGLDACFDAIVDGNDTRCGKPDPEAFLLAATRLGLAPGQCVVIEDAAAGVEAARRAGMAVVGIGLSPALPDVAVTFEDLANLTVERLLANEQP